jgi:hypothetical protein
MNLLILFATFQSKNFLTTKSEVSGFISREFVEFLLKIFGSKRGFTVGSSTEWGSSLQVKFSGINT